MSIDTTFKPTTETYVFDNTAAIQVKGANQRGATTFRLVARVANVYVAWGPTAPTAPAAPAAVGVLPANVIGLTVGVPCYLELPPNSFFIGSLVFASGNVEITGGIGGIGG